MNIPRPSRPTALAGAAAVLAAAALTVSITAAVTQPPTPDYYAMPAGIPQLSVSVACTPGTDHGGIATVHIAAHTTGLAWHGTLTDSPATGVVAVHRFSEAGVTPQTKPDGWDAVYPVTGRGVVQLGSDQSWVAAATSPVAYDCHP